MGELTPSKFRSVLQLSPLSSAMIANDGDEFIDRSMEKNWVVLQPFTYYAGEVGSTTYFTVPEGFITDLASTPRLLWWFIPPFGRHAAAAVLHDYLYRTKELMHVDRKYADLLFHEAMLVSGTPRARARVMYWAVRLGGFRAFQKR